MALGSYPAMGLADARKARDAAKLHRSEGRDPVQVRKAEKNLRASTRDDTSRPLPRSGTTSKSLHGVTAMQSVPCAS